MSSQTTRLNTGSMLITTTDTSKIFIFDNKYETASWESETNSTYDDVTYPAGTVLGRIAANNTVTPMTSGASDGSQFPVGILAQDLTIEAGDTFDGDITMCVAGEVAESEIELDGSDTLATVVSSKTIRDRIGSDTVGIILRGGTDLTAYDNY